MRRGFLLFFLCISLLAGYSQSGERMIDEYRMPDVEVEKHVFLKMPFGKYNVESILHDWDSLHLAGEIIIDVICTDYPSGSSLKTLNENRLNECMETFPFLKGMSIKEINYLRQQKGAERSIAEKMLHGVVIRYRPRQTAETMKHDLKKLEEMLNPVIGKDESSLTDDQDIYPNVIEEDGVEVDKKEESKPGSKAGSKE